MSSNRGSWLCSNRSFANRADRLAPYWLAALKAEPYQFLACRGYDPAYRFGDGAQKLHITCENLEQEKSAVKILLGQAERGDRLSGSAKGTERDVPNRQKRTIIAIIVFGVQRMMNSMRARGYQQEFADRSQGPLQLAVLQSGPYEPERENGIKLGR